MATIAVPTIESASPKPVAPWWHTGLLLTLFLGIALSGAFFQRQARLDPAALHQHARTVPLYLSLIAMEWGLFYFVWKGGTREGRITLRELIGGRWTSAKDVLVDAGLALGLWAAWTLVDKAWDHWLGPGHAVSIQKLLPQRTFEIFLWIGLCISAGICEELVFRGYFQRQFHAYTHSRWVALILQAGLFGISHGYQGIEACVKIAVYGALFSLLALWRKSLRPGMMAHAWTDILSGLFGI